MTLSKVFNFLLRSFLIFIVSYMWLTFYMHNIILVFLIAFTITFTVNFAFYLWARRTRTGGEPHVPKPSAAPYLLNINNAKIMIYPFFKTLPTEKDLTAIPTDPSARIYIAAKSFSSNFKKAARAKKVYLLTYKSRAHLLFHLVRVTAFKKRKARGYIVMGLAILGASFLVRFNIYYLAAASVMFLFAIVSLFELPLTRDNPFTR